MILLWIVCLVVAGLSFYNGVISAGVFALLGPSKKGGLFSLIISSIILFFNGYWIIGFLPILIIIYNLFGLLYLKKNNLY